MTRQQDLMQRDAGIAGQLGWIAEELKALARVQEGLHDLYTSVLGRDVSLEAVLREVTATAMDLVNARYGALGVLSADGDHLDEFIAFGLTEEEAAAAAPLGVPRGGGLLAHLMSDPRPVRVDSISDHPMAKGLPPGHPPVHTLLGVGISSRGHRYGNLFVADRRDGRSFDEHDETMIVALAGGAGLAIDDARLLGQVRSEAEDFQRLLLPHLPDLRPIEAAALYVPATAPRSISGDWYDAMRLPDGTYAVAIGDIAGHGVHAAAAMAQTRSMLHALLYDLRSSPGAVLTQLDLRLQATTDTPLTTACLGYLQSAGPGWSLRCSLAGHPAPLLLVPGQQGRYLDANPGLPLGVDCSAARPDYHQQLPGGVTLVFFTDGLIEHHEHSIDEGLAALAQLATEHADQSPERLCRALVDDHPGDGSDDIAILVLRLPAAGLSVAALPESLHDQIPRPRSGPRR
jgi:Stage II sporulation protein E (SpoIIE)/GAF domain